MPVRQLMCIPSREPMSNGLVRDLVFRHRCDDPIVYKQPIYLQRLVACRIRRLGLDRLSPFCICNAGDQGSFEQFRFVPEFLHRYSPMPPGRQRSVATISRRLDGSERSSCREWVGKPLIRPAQTLPRKKCPTVKRSNLPPPGEPFIEMARESVAIRMRERWRTSADIPARTHGVHEVSHREYASDCVR